ncbi:Regulator of microtubule dynamics protein 1 [Strongyloides ratti]|uniref:Regulator of microtubule dynamics protein 1 n=1 Tax=Strongyloides ratti TaxID=34506 RepID=A0A090LBX4_STRRB|nr:Regulator of microtubule dynamics protein 1 [Strongyloides ratti]CEF67276.1 Regulator of microtubule dynamics protein 1 [Strongyloides ratti]
MQSIRFLRLFSTSKPTLLRCGSKQKYSNGYSVKFGGHLKKIAIGTGTTGTLLGLSFWGSATKDDDDNSRFSAIPSKNKEVHNLDLIIRETDALYNNYLIDNAYAILRKHSSGTNPELLWRLARVLCEKGKISKNSEERKIFFMEAYNVCKKALDNEPIEGSFGAHKWMAIILDYVGEIEGSKSRIKKSYEVKEHLNRALELNPLDATTWYILGVWHFTFADMPTYQYYIAKTIFSTPPSSTYEEALSYFEKAEAVQPDFYSKNTYYLAECYDRLGKKEEAKLFYMKAFKMPVISVDDKEVHDNAYKKLKALGVKENEFVN